MFNNLLLSLSYYNLLLYISALYLEHMLPGVYLLLYSKDLGIMPYHTDKNLENYFEKVVHKDR
jgi:hypothetical protein